MKRIVLCRPATFDLGACRSVDRPNERSLTLHSRCVIALLLTCLAAGCDSVREDARRDDLKALELAGIGRPLEEQLQHVGQAVQLVPNSGYFRERRANLLFGLGRPEDSGDWEEQYTWSEDAGRGPRRSSVEKTGSRFADCSLAVYGPLTEFACPDRRSTYVGDRHLGGNNDPTLGSVVRYAAEIDGTFAYFVIVDWNSVNHIRIVFRSNDGWFEDGVPDDRTVC